MFFLSLAVLAFGLTVYVSAGAISSARSYISSDHRNRAPGAPPKLWPLIHRAWRFEPACCASPASGTPVAAGDAGGGRARGFLLGGGGGGRGDAEEEGFSLLQEVRDGAAQGGDGDGGGDDWRDAGVVDGWGGKRGGGDEEGQDALPSGSNGARRRVTGAPGGAGASGRPPFEAVRRESPSDTGGDETGVDGRQLLPVTSSGGGAANPASRRSIVMAGVSHAEWGTGPGRPAGAVSIGAGAIMSA